MLDTPVLDILSAKKEIGQKSLSVLIDPDKTSEQEIVSLVSLCATHAVDFIMVGGSLLRDDNFSRSIKIIKDYCSIPVVIFPGNHLQIDSNADALMLLSLISGRNPDLLIGQHVLSAPILKKSSLEILPVGYMLVNSGPQTSVSYMSNTTPIPSNKPTIAACTAMAGELLGMKIVYMDAGSGAMESIPQKVISIVSKSIDIPLIVGGGLNTINKVDKALEAGADMIVIGTAIEDNEGFLAHVSNKIKTINGNKK